MSDDRIEVCDAAELPPGERVLVEIDAADLGDLDDADGETGLDEDDSVPVCVFNVDGDLYALGARCRHRGGPICKGELKARGDRGAETDLVVACPWHGWEYDVETGAHSGPPDVSLPSYRVTVENGVVYLE